MTLSRTVLAVAFPSVIFQVRGPVVCLKAEILVPNKRAASIQCMSCHLPQLICPKFILVVYLLGVRGRFQGAAIVLGVHHGHVRAAVVHLLHAVHAAALAACAD